MAILPAHVMDAQYQQEAAEFERHNKIWESVEEAAQGISRVCSERGNFGHKVARRAVHALMLDMAAALQELKEV